MPTPDQLHQRVASLTAHFERVQRERMAGIPMLNPALSVAAVGFEWAATEPGTLAMAEGVLITPWFMNLIRLPADVLPHQNRVGRKSVRDFGGERFDFIGAHDPAVGYHETCALFSPMQGFDSQARALETAREVLALTRAQPEAPKPEPEPESAAARASMPSRRAFFTPGRSATR